ncbi:MAG: hypothetical protein IJP35_06035 [Clostridia bacterium]|nr:hypothetical protein [Clostridia bacterium]
MKEKFWAYGIGIMCAVGLLTGLVILLLKTPMAITTAIVIICLSICFGILLPNPISFWGLIAGICMLVLPANVTGIGLIALSGAGALTNGLFFTKAGRKENAGTVK